MSSVNEHLPPPPKPRMSPLDYRNTDLVSRLLAATPPYLYNMSLLPNTYFFSEMLRSFVQAKTDAANRPASVTPHGRRTRKRPWTLSSSSSTNRTEPFQKSAAVSPKTELMPINCEWHAAKNAEHRVPPESPLELTTRTQDNSSQISESSDEQSNRTTSSNTKMITDNYNNNNNVNLLMLDKKIPSSDGGPSNNIMNYHSNLHNSNMNSVFPSTHHQQDANASGGLILPPPPPMWYPPLYPTAPYGIDPLHFFIDLRVSGHIYNKKNNQNKEATSISETAVAAATSSSSSQLKLTEQDLNRDQHHHHQHQFLAPTKDTFKQSRHASAFSVPVPYSNKGAPMNLSHNENPHHENSKNIKFDVKSMGFEKLSNRTGTTYVMTNIENIYKNVSDSRKEDSAVMMMSTNTEECTTKSVSSPDNKNTNNNDNNEDETEEQREKRVKDLRALIGLELVVDYMNHAKPQLRRQETPVEESSSTDLESVDSPTLEVVALHDEI